MPALLTTSFRGEVVWLGRVADRSEDLVSRALERAELRFSGIDGEDHGGLTRPSCSRVIALYPRGTEIRNTRQLSVVSSEELAEIARAMNIDRLDPAWIGASVVVRGIPDFSHLPPSSRLQAPSGATLTIDMANRPCHLPAAPIDREIPGAGRNFKTAARDRRGVTAWVERAGEIALGDTLRLFVPDQRPWSGTATIGHAAG
ncbi:MAG: sulfurase [Pseudomonadota bacterium]